LGHADNRSRISSPDRSTRKASFFQLLQASYKHKSMRLPAHQLCLCRKKALSASQKSHYASAKFAISDSMRKDAETAVPSPIIVSTAGVP
jgi:hypothetical protein